MLILQINSTRTFNLFFGKIIRIMILKKDFDFDLDNRKMLAQLITPILNMF